jgi:hypothetical protein
MGELNGKKNYWSELREEEWELREFPENRFDGS